MTASADLSALADELEAMADMVEQDPSQWMSWLPLQAKFLADPSAIKLIRAGNQTIGKTTVALTEVHWRCIGEHPHFSVEPPPVEFWVVCAEVAQSISIQQKFHAIAHTYLDDSTEFDDVRGYRGRQTVAKYANGSIVRFKTTNQSSISFAGATLTGGILFDEPPKSARLFSEAQKRVLRHGGVVLLALTPVNAPCEWLRKLCEEGVVSDHHTELTPDQLIPVGEVEPLHSRHPTTRELVPMDAAYIEALEKVTVAYEVPVVVHGEWEMRTEGRYFGAFDDILMVSDGCDAATVSVCLGIDYGSKEGKQCAVLCLVEEGDSGVAKRVWVWDCYVGAENSGLDGDARGILEMLRRNGLSWKQIDKAFGDRIYMRGAEHKSNRDLMKAVSRTLRIPDSSLRPRLRTVKKGGNSRGSVSVGGRWLHQLMVQGGMFVHPRCQLYIDAFNKWDFTDDKHGHKDKIDSVRYALWDYIFHRAQQRSGQTPVYMY
jgi:hypothetical protein